MVGGFAPTALTFTPTLIAGKVGKTVLRRVSLPFTEAGAKFRAGQFIKGQVPDADIAAQRAAEETIGSLPPAVASNEKRLMVLYNKLRAADPVTDQEAIKKVSHSIYQLEQELRSQGYGAPEILQNVTYKRVASLQMKMDKRVADAMEIADNKLNALPIAKRQSQESIVVRNELDKVMRAEKVDVDRNWAKVPKKVIVDPLGSKTLYKQLLDETPKAQLEDIPAVLKRSFVAKKVKQRLKIPNFRPLK